MKRALEGLANEEEVVKLKLEKDAFIENLELQSTEIEENIELNDLVEFEWAYKRYLLEKTKMEQEQPITELDNLITAIFNLNSIYPSGRLLDCNYEEDELEGKIILGQNKLGNTLKT